MPHTPRQAIRYGREALDRFARLASIGEHADAYRELVKARNLIADAETAWVASLRQDGASWTDVAEYVDRSYPTVYERYREVVNAYLEDLERERQQQHGATA